jgi:tetratricopeptide (TPR) repeat protein
MDGSASFVDLLTEGLSSRYRIERELGRGGMATVFLARDIAHDRPVAVKVLHPEIVAGFSTERFLREIRLLATLQHPNILPLYDSGAVSGIPYYVMPFVAGESLRNRLSRDTRVALPLALRMTTEAAAALDYAHRQGIVHRDIKPENILLSDDHVIIADFGIARAAARSAGDQITGTSVAIGTPAYMSPEQAAGDATIDGRSDIYSLACVLFETISGQQPFTGPTPASVIASRFARPAPRISAIREGIPKAVDAAIASALSLSPDDRPQTAAAFSAMLAGDSVPHTTRRARRTGILAAAVVIMIAAVGLRFAWRPREHAAGSTPSAAVTSNHIVNREAYELYLEGQKNLEVPSIVAVNKAADLFRAAIARDSLYAEAWAGLADTHSSRGVGNFESIPPRPEFEQARVAALRALQLDSSLAEAHAALALVQMMYDYNWKGAALSLDKAQLADPGYAITYLYRSFLLTWLGRFDSATAVAREGLHMNPNDFRFRQDVGRTLILGRRYAEAERELRADVDREPKNSRLRMLFGDALIAQGKIAEGIRQLDESQKLAPATTRVTAFRVAGYARGGRKRDAQLLLNSLIAMSDKAFVQSMDIAIAWAGMASVDQTLTWLERSYNDRTLRPFVRDPVFDFVRSEPRYRALLRKMNLEP